MKSQTEKIFEHCKTGKWTCQTWFWSQFIRYPANRRQELADQLNRHDDKYIWRWETDVCKCEKDHKTSAHRLLKSKV